MSRAQTQFLTVARESPFSNGPSCSHSDRALACPSPARLMFSSHGPQCQHNDYKGGPCRGFAKSGLQHILLVEVGLHEATACRVPNQNWSPWQSVNDSLDVPQEVLHKEHGSTLSANASGQD